MTVVLQSQILKQLEINLLLLVIVQEWGRLQRLMGLHSQHLVEEQADPQLLEVRPLFRYFSSYSAVIYSYKESEIYKSQIYVEFRQDVENEM